MICTRCGKKYFSKNTYFCKDCNKFVFSFFKGMKNEFDKLKQKG